MKKSSEECAVMCWNVWSILNENKLLNFPQILEDYGVSIAWFDSKNGTFTSNIKMSGFEIHHAYRENKRGGGTAILYKSELQIKEGDASTSQYTSFEYSYVTLTIQAKRKLLICCLYRKQEVAFHMFHDELSTFINNIESKCDILLVVGDFNVWKDVEENKDARSVTTLLNAHGLHQAIQEPTHRDGHTLDQVYYNDCQLEINH